MFRPVTPRAAGDAESRFAVLIDEVGTSVDMVRVARSLAAATPGDVAVRLSRRGRTATLSTAPGWAEAHPRTLFLLEEEHATWSRVTSLQLALAT